MQCNVKNTKISCKFRSYFESLRSIIHLNKAGEGRRKPGMDLSLFVSDGNGKSIVENWKRNKWKSLNLMQFLLQRYSIYPLIVSKLPVVADFVFVNQINWLINSLVLEPHCDDHKNIQ